MRNRSQRLHLVSLLTLLFTVALVLTAMPRASQAASVTLSSGSWNVEIGSAASRASGFTNCDDLCDIFVGSNIDCTYNPATDTVTLTSMGTQNPVNFALPAGTIDLQTGVSTFTLAAVPTTVKLTAASSGVDLLAEETPGGTRIGSWSSPFDVEFSLSAGATLTFTASSPSTVAFEDLDTAVPFVQPGGVMLLLGLVGAAGYRWARR